LTIWRFTLSAELTKTHSFRMFFWQFAHWGRDIDIYLNLTDGL